MADKPLPPKRFHLVATSPCEVTNCFCAPQLNIMKIQGVPGNALMCVQILAHRRGGTHALRIPCVHQHTPCTYKMPTYLLHMYTQTDTHTHLFAWWTFIRVQSGGIMWFKQSRSWQTCSPAELKISPNTLRDQIKGPYVDLDQSSQNCVCVCVHSVCACVWHVCTHVQY